MSIAALDDAEPEPPERQLALLRSGVVPNVALRGQRWEVSDDLAAELAPVLVSR